ncbi:MAG: DUF1998 domain-containing protein [Halobacteriota archaeon]
MANIFAHEIAENSAFFQGHIGQFFSSEHYSFRIISNASDFDKTTELNIKRFKPAFAKEMNRYIGKRNEEGANIAYVDPDTLRVEALRLVDSNERKVSCGEYEIFPDSAICTKDGCNQYFKIKEGKQCTHNKDTDWRQITFLSFCKDCGWLMPLHYNTNITNSCLQCNEPQGLSKLSWTKRDDLNTYKVQCTRCNAPPQRLFFYECRHKNDDNNEVMSTLPPISFQGMTARASAIVHPKVISLPEITPGAEAGGSRTIYEHGRFFSEAFSDFFPGITEQLLHLPQFRMAVLHDREFWNSKKVLVNCEELNIDPEKKADWPHSDFVKLVQSIVMRAKQLINWGLEPTLIKEQYLINTLAAALNEVKEIETDEKDWQGYFLLTLNPEDQKTSVPKCPPEDYSKWLKNFGLRRIDRKPNLRMIQALLGIIEGSTRRDPMLFRPLVDRKTAEPIVYIRYFFTEGISFELNYDALIKWVLNNKEYIDRNLVIDESLGSEAAYNTALLNSERCKKAVEVLLHTYSHMIIQQSTVDTGLDERSLSEMIFPKTGSIFIYSTNSVNIGGLEYTFNYHLEDWLQRIKDLAANCPQDPGCMKDEGGSCNACSYVPEFVCERFNLDLDRSALVGGGNFAVGYFL